MTTGTLTKLEVGKTYRAPRFMAKARITITAIGPNDGVNFNVAYTFQVAKCGGGHGAVRQECAEALFIPARVGVVTEAKLAKVAAMWRAGENIATIANSLFTSVNTAWSWLRRARALWGEKMVPRRASGWRIGQGRVESPLDSITQPGDVVTGTKGQLGSRPNVYQNALTRGWAVKIKDRGDSWEIRALARVPSLANIRAAKKTAAAASASAQPNTL